MNQSNIPRCLKFFERTVIVTLIAMLVIVILFTVVELGHVILYDIITPPFGLGLDKLFGIFASFLMVLIGVELLESIRAYLKKGVVHVEIVLTVALIAVARKVIILDIKEFPGPMIIGLGVLILALATAMYLIKNPRQTEK